jgi:IclR family transcriptional regulator, KDG regulon repressor
MIQVIERTFSIMELLSPDKGVSLDRLTRSTGLNKGTLCNILKSLVELGYVQKDGNGTYIISKNFYALAHPYSQDKRIIDIADYYVKILASETKESGVIATLNDAEKVQIIAQHQFNRSVMVSAEVYKSLSLYASVTGRVLLSYQPEETLRMIIKDNGYPNEEWNNISNWDELQKNITAIRKSEMAVMENKDLEIKAFAVPVVNADNNICASLGLTVPLARLDEKSVIIALRENQKNMSDAIQSFNQV